MNGADTKNRQGYGFQNDSPYAYLHSPSSSVYGGTSAFPETNPVLYNPPSSGSTATSALLSPHGVPHNGGHARSHGPPSAGSSIASMNSFISSAWESEDNVRVVVRVRPLLNYEMEKGYYKVMDCVDDGRSVTVQNATNSKAARSSFTFSATIGEQADQQTFFEMSGVKHLLLSALDGYSATVFAYGQTGSGKTFSISGPEEQVVNEDFKGHDLDGMIPRAVRFMFDQMAQETAQFKTQYKVRASYLEIYNEQINDLLSMTSENLAIRWNSSIGFFVEGLVVADCLEYNDVIAVFCEGLRNRKVGSHDLNKDSSRSHSIMTVYLDSETTESDGTVLTRYGKVSFVDLAGSEKLKESKSEGSTRKETAQINKSLFALGNVIAALSSSKKNQHVPYRDSKLTKLLMDSLGGSSLTLMVACCSPASHHVEETLNTLYYAGRAKSIRNQPIVQMDQHQEVVMRLKKEVQMLRLENAYLRQQLGMPAASTPGSVNTTYQLFQNPSPRNFTPPYHSGSNSVRRRDAKPAGAPLPPLEMPGSNTNEFINENGRLRGENTNIVRRLEVVEKEYVAVMAENERLRSKLEGLEDIFVKKGEDEEWGLSPRNRAKGGTSDGIEGTDIAGDDQFEMMKVENRRLKRQIDKMNEENAELQSQLHKLQLARSKQGIKNYGSVRKEQNDLFALRKSNDQLVKKCESISQREKLLAQLLEENGIEVPPKE